MVNNQEFEELKARILQQIPEVKFHDGRRVTDNEHIVYLIQRVYRLGYDEGRAFEDKKKEK